MGRTLYQIGDDLLRLYAAVDEAGGDVTAFEAELDAWAATVAADEAAKLDGYVALIGQLDMEADAARKEAAGWAAAAKARAAAADRLRGWAVLHLTRTGRTEARTASGHRLCLTANGGKPPLVLAPGVGPDDVLDRFIKRTEAIDPDAVRAALDAGEAVGFARYGERGTHLRVRK